VGRSSLNEIQANGGNFPTACKQVMEPVEMEVITLDGNIPAGKLMEFHECESAELDSLVVWLTIVNP